MSIDSRYTWDSVRSGESNAPGSRRQKLGFWVLLSVTVAVILHAAGLWALGKFNLLLELADFEWTSQTFRVSETQELPVDVVAPIPDLQDSAPASNSEALLTEIEELFPELDDMEIDILPVVEKPRVSLAPMKPARLGKEDGPLLEPLKAPEVQATLANLGRNEPLFTEVPDGRVVIEEGSISADLPDPDSFLKDAAVGGANGLDENGLLDGYTELGRYLGFDVDQLDQGRAALPSDLLFEFNQNELKQNARLGLMKLGMLIDRNPGMYCILEGHSDLFGSESYNLELSRKRAMAVKDWLVNSLGLDGERIIVRAYGHSRPKVLSGNQKEQGVNRRVDILMRKTVPPQEALPVRIKPAIVLPEPASPARPRIPAKALPVEEKDPSPPPPPENVVRRPSPARAIPVEESPPGRAIPVEEEAPNPPDVGEPLP